MDGNLASSMLYGCKLAKDLEQNLPLMLANQLQPHILLISCEEIVRVFSNIKERLIIIISQGQMMSVIRQPQELQLQLDDHDHHIGGAGIQECLKTGGTTTTNIITHDDEPMASANIGDMYKYHPSPGLEFMVGGSGGEIKPSVNAPDSSKTSSSQKQRRRKDEGYKLVMRVPAPQMGNLDVPPEDGHTWRKYGQKEILGSPYPRSYYRCTHQKFYSCPAKKQVQRLRDDPFTFEVTYRGTHTCHVMSSTTSPEQRPSLPPSITTYTTNIVQPPIISSSSLPTTSTHWLSMQLLRDLGGDAGGAAGPSASRFHDYQLPVADMADAMFNSASSSSNSMDLIFSSMDDHKWDSEDKKD